MMVNGNLGAGVAVAGAFSLVRFRSVPGTAKEITMLFLAMGAGLLNGMGYLAYALLFTLILCTCNILYNRLDFGAGKNNARYKTLTITIPEDLEYNGVFEGILTEYASDCSLVRVKTTNMGSMFRLTYNLTLRDVSREKEMIDKLRCRNGNLEISLAPQESAASFMLLDGGSFTITTGGGSVNGAKSSSDSWGAFPGGGMGGGKHQSGGRGGAPTDSMPQPEGESPAEPAVAEDDSTSLKGLKAGGELTINGGNFTIDSADDAVHSNASLTVNGGSFAIASGDDGFHADETLTINGGTIRIDESYEGLEGLNVIVAGGEISLTATDDGLNAAGGTDNSGMGGRGGDKFGGMGAMGGPGMGGTGSSASITISGGSLYVNASGDGIDSNGTLTISGGYTVVCGPTQGDTSTLDYETSGVITGGTFIGTGASGMAQTFSSSEQGVIAVSVGSCAAGTAITLTDADGNTVISYSPELSFAVVILSSPEIVKGQPYTITVGSASGTFEAT